jgi:histidyl-tRNA synthetase
MERLVLLLAQLEGAAAAAGPEIYVVSRGERAEAEALGLARQLRLQGRAVELDLSGAAFGKQLKRADRSGAAWAVLIGDSEAEQGEVILKALRDPALPVGAAAASGEQRLPQPELLRQFA